MRFSYQLATAIIFSIFFVSGCTPGIDEEIIRFSDANNGTSFPTEETDVTAAECIVDIDCDDGIAVTFDSCDGGVCTHTLPSGTCLEKADCPDQLGTYTYCANNRCIYPADPCESNQFDAFGLCIEYSCLTDLDCNDGNDNTLDVCEDNACVHSIKGCASNNDCNDGPLGTIGICNTITGECFYTVEEQNCNDGDPCTVDSQNPITGECEYEAKDCFDGNPCTMDLCSPSEGGCFHTQQVCDDGDPTTTDICLPQGGGNNIPFSCEFIPSDCTGGCDDNNPCTTDTCDMGSLSCVYESLSCGPGTFCDPQGEYPDGEGFCEPETQPECDKDSDCTDGPEGTIASCKVGGECSYSVAPCGEGVVFDEDTGMCEQEKECELDSECADENECTFNEFCSDAGVCVRSEVACGDDAYCDYKTGVCDPLGGDEPPFACGDGLEIVDGTCMIPMEDDPGCTDGELVCGVAYGHVVVAICFDGTLYAPPIGSANDCGPVTGSQICGGLPLQCLDQQEP